MRFRSAKSLENDPIFFYLAPQFIHLSTEKL